MTISLKNKLGELLRNDLGKVLFKKIPENFRKQKISINTMADVNVFPGLKNCILAIKIAAENISKFNELKKFAIS